MKRTILGISAYYHDSAAAIIQDNKIIAAVQEERFTRKKHDSDLPINAVNYCLDAAKIKDINSLDAIVFYDKPILKFMRIFQTFLQQAPFGYRQFMKAIPVWLKQKLWTEELIQKELNYQKDILFSEHHISHAASAFYPSPFKRTAFLTVDGVGEWTTTSFGVGNESSLEIHSEIKFPDSLGLLYSAFTYFCGFKVNSGEYKLMGLAPYGEPKYTDIILENLIDIKEDGSFRLNQKYFSYLTGLRMTGRQLENLLQVKRRKPESSYDQVYMDIAASIQAVTETILIKLAKHVKKTTGEKNLCLAGGVALNCVANGKILKNKIFDNVWIQPASGDAGGALGAALAANYLHFKEKRAFVARPETTNFGPEYTNTQIEQAIDEMNLTAVHVKDYLIPKKAAEIIASKQVLGWFQGKMEFGPRALGNRSILADPRSVEMQSKVNLKIKFRESFRPFAPSVLEDKANKFFNLNTNSPYMLLTTDIKKKKNIKENSSLTGIDKLKVSRSNIPAVTHVDYSARVQTVKKSDNPLYYRLINHFEKITKIPVIINTSFNVRGEPIVCTPKDALQCFLSTGMDALFIGNYLLIKKDQDPSILLNLKNIRANYELD